MHTSETIYQTLLHADIGQLPRLCSINKQYYDVCHNHYFLQQKFNQLPVDPQHAPQTLKRLLTLNKLTNAAYQLMDFIASTKDAAIYYNFNMIGDFHQFNPTLADRLETMANKKSMTLYHQPLTDYVFVQDQLLSYDKDIGFYLYFILITTDDMDIFINVPLSSRETVDFLIHLFLRYKRLTLFANGENHYYDSLDQLLSNI